MAEIPYRKAYIMRVCGEDGLNTTVTIPPEVIRREAEKRDLIVKEFREKFLVIAHYNGIEGVLYTFEEKPNKNSRRNSSG